MSITYVGTPAGQVNTSTGAFIGGATPFGAVSAALSYFTAEGHVDVICPGSGNQDVEDLGMYTGTSGGSDTLRVGLYTISTDTDYGAGVLMAQFTSATSITNTGGVQSWYNQTAGGITQYHQPIGGRHYILCWTCSTGSLDPSHVVGSSGDSNYKLIDYTSSGFPSTIPAFGGSDTNDWVLRLGVQPSGGGGSPPVLTSIAPTSAYANSTNDVIVKGVELDGTSMGGGSPTVNVPGGWAATNLVVTGTTKAVFDMKIPAGTSAGNNNITFTTADGTSGAEVFTVSSPGGSGVITSYGLNGGFQ